MTNTASADEGNKGIDDVDVFDIFATDKQAEREGIWLKYGKCRVKIAHASTANKLFEAKMTAALRPHRRAIDQARLPDTEFRKAVLPVYVDMIVLGWENMPLEKGGEPVPFTRENAIAVFTALPNLFADIVTVAGDYTAFKAVGKGSDDDVKN